MASVATFFENLWESVFIPGTTPTLLVATNVTFAALQLLLFTLLLATHSIHFIILSGLTAGLWWAINWFATEIRAAQAKEEEAKRIREARREKEKGKQGGAGAGSEVEAMDTGDDTEVDTEVEVKHKPKPQAKAKAPRPEMQSTVFVERPTERGRGGTPVPVQAGSGPTTASTTGASASLAPAADDTVKMRKSLGESTGELSTDSEWEKLSQDSGDR